SSPARMRPLPAQHLRIFTVEVTLNIDTFRSPFDFLQKREWEWSARDQAAYLAAKPATDKAPVHLKRSIFHKIFSPYGITGINAGETEAVHERTLPTLHRQQRAEAA